MPMSLKLGPELIRTVKAVPTESVARRMPQWPVSAFCLRANGWEAKALEKLTRIPAAQLTKMMQNALSAWTIALETKIETESRLSKFQVDSTISDHRVGSVRPNNWKPWRHWIQTPTAASWISSGLTGSSRTQAVDNFITASVGSGDSGEGRRFRTSSSREKVLTSKDGLERPSLLRRDWGHPAVAGLLRAVPRGNPRLSILVPSDRVHQWLSCCRKPTSRGLCWPLLELAAGSVTTGKHLAPGVTFVPEHPQRKASDAHRTASNEVSAALGQGV